MYYYKKMIKKKTKITPLLISSCKLYNFKFIVIKFFFKIFYILYFEVDSDMSILWTKVLACIDARKPARIRLNVAMQPQPQYYVTGDTLIETN